jgi:uncharacterized protein YbaP (TraB family)
MRRLLALVTALAVATACAPVARHQATTSAAAAPAPLLWRVERGPTRSHLFGTMHIGVTMADGLTPLGLARLDAARRVVVELDLADPEAVALATRQMAAMGILPPGESLQAMLPPAQWATFVALHDGAIPAAALDRLQPWFAALSAVGRLELRRAAADATGPTEPPLPMDVAIARRAKGAGIPVEGLEHTADQVRAFGDLGRTEGLALLGELLDDVDAVTVQLRTLQGAYAGGDNAAALAAYVDAMTRDSPALTELLLFRRNRRWMPRLQRRFLEGGAFVAVGAAHLFGEEGLIALLRARGWTVTRERASQQPGQ